LDRDKTRKPASHPRNIALANSSPSPRLAPVIKVLGIFFITPARMRRQMTLLWPSRKRSRSLADAAEIA